MCISVEELRAPPISGCFRQSSFSSFSSIWCPDSVKTSIFGFSSISPFSSKTPFFWQGRPSASQEPTKKETCHPKDDFRVVGWGCSFWTWKTHRGIRMARPALAWEKGGDGELGETAQRPPQNSLRNKSTVWKKHGLEGPECFACKPGIGSSSTGSQVFKGLGMRAPSWRRSTR